MLRILYLTWSELGVTNIAVYILWLITCILVFCVCVFLFFYIYIVVFVCCAPDIFRQLMVNFRKANLPHEEFVFIYIDVFGRTVASQPARPWARGDDDDDLAKEAYQVGLRRDFTYRELQCTCIESQLILECRGGGQQQGITGKLRNTETEKRGTVN